MAIQTDNTPMRDGPVILLCSERCGSNLVSRMFGSHPEICAPVPAHLYRILCGSLHRFPDVAQDAGWAAFLAALRDLFAVKTGHWTLDHHPEALDEALGGVAQGDPVGAIAAVYAAEARLTGKHILFIKENAVHTYIAAILSQYPEARFLFLVRDPRDMALSWLKAPALRGGPVRAARQWLADQSAFLNLVMTAGQRFRSAVIRYEDLASRPEATLDTACTALGLAFDDRMLRFHEGASVVANARVVAEWQNTAQPLIKDNWGKFRTGLDERQIAFVEAVCGELMRLFGYENTVAGAIDFPALEADLLAAEPHEKPAYAKLPEEERALRARWVATVADIQGRTAPPLFGQPPEGTS